MPRRSEPDPFALKLGRRIELLFRAQKLSLEQFSNQCGLSKGHMSNVVRGLCVTTVITVRNVARGLGVPIAALFAFPEDGLYEQLIDEVRQLERRDVEELLAVAREKARRGKG